MVSGPFFGGLSGVFMAFLVIVGLAAAHLVQFPPALVTFSVVWMVIGFTPFPEMLGLGAWQTKAHFGGFVQVWRWQPFCLSA